MPVTAERNVGGSGHRRILYPMDREIARIFSAWTNIGSGALGRESPCVPRL
jgi:hypothetical protein